MDLIMNTLQKMADNLKANPSVYKAVEKAEEMAFDGAEEEHEASETTEEEKKEHLKGEEIKKKK